MWIKTMGGALLNADRAETIYYDPEDNTTKAYIGDSYCEIAEGDVTPILVRAITNARNYVGVQ